MEASINTPVAVEKDRAFTDGESKGPDVGAIKQSLDVARVDMKGALTGLEKIAYFVAAVMMLSPLAVAAWGANLGT